MALTLGVAACGGDAGSETGADAAGLEIVIAEGFEVSTPVAAIEPFDPGPGNDTGDTVCPDGSEPRAPLPAPTEAGQANAEQGALVVYQRYQSVSYTHLTLPTTSRV